MEEQQQHLNPLAITHLLQHTLRSLCLHENSQWVYAVFWRILPRNFPPPKWDSHGAYERSRGNRRNWILVWEDGFCNFAASTAVESGGDGGGGNGDRPSSSSSGYGGCEFPQYYQGLKPELFFKMSHEIYNYGEGVIGKVAADYSHKWIYKEPPNEQEINFLSAWHNSVDSFPRTWEAQFQAGIKTIALIAVREGVVQLGAIDKVSEDLSYVVSIRKRFSYIESIPGVLLPHPSSATYPHYINPDMGAIPQRDVWHFQHLGGMVPPLNAVEMYDNRFGNEQQHQPVIKITPSMSSLEALLSKLPAVIPPPPPQEAHHFVASTADRPTTLELITTKEEIEEDYYHQPIVTHHVLVGESSGSMCGGYHDHYQHSRHHLHESRNDTSCPKNNGYSD